jgi:two-component system, OmpR family, osmolarity sensor histidine kinase EnvZ
MGRGLRADSRLSKAIELRISLFWRTFLLLAVSTLLSVTVTLQMFRWFNKVPPEQQIAWELASAVNLTRNALVSSSGEKRRTLLATLARDEGASLSPLEPNDMIEAEPDSFGELDITGIDARLKALLGEKTKLALKVNGESGTWVSFEIDSDAYWLHLNRNRIKRHASPPFFTIAAIALALSLVATLALGRLINQPLRNLANAINSMGSGLSPPKLKEQGPTEIAQLNTRFNRMAADLDALEDDRRIALAGISHDIRSPLARLRMEIELSTLSEDEKLSMANEIQQVDRIVGQFVDFARSQNDTKAEEISVAEEIAACTSRYRPQVERGELKLMMDVQITKPWHGKAIDLQRVIANLLDNALRYGQSADGICRVSLLATLDEGGVSKTKRLKLVLSDQGKGVDKADLTRLTRPFARVDVARDSSGGSGLGLAIVERTARRYDGTCKLSLNKPTGLTVEVLL